MTQHLQPLQAHLSAFPQVGLPERLMGRGVVSNRRAWTPDSPDGQQPQHLLALTGCSYCPGSPPLPCSPDSQPTPSPVSSCSFSFKALRPNGETLPTLQLCYPEVAQQRTGLLETMLETELSIPLAMLGGALSLQRGRPPSWLQSTLLRGAQSMALSAP